MSKELVKIEDEFNIPEKFNKYEFVAFIAKTTSKKYEFILYTISKQPSIDITINNKLWHIVGFEKTINDFINLGNLLEFTEGLKNVYLYQRGMLINISRYRFFDIQKCIKNAMLLNNHSIYCREKDKKLKENFSNPWQINTNFTFNISLEEKEKPKYSHIEGAEQNFPCHLIQNNYFNPYEHEIEDLKESYLSYAIKRNSDIVNYCPLFNIDNYSCTFKDEIISTD